MIFIQYIRFIDFELHGIRRHHRNRSKINLEELNEELGWCTETWFFMLRAIHLWNNMLNFIQYTKLKPWRLPFSEKYLVMRFKGIKVLIFSSSNLKRHVKLLEEVTKFYLVNIQRTSVIPFFVGSHRKVKRWSGICFDWSTRFWRIIWNICQMQLHEWKHTETVKIFCKITPET